jgi:hypothetical protein
MKPKPAPTILLTAYIIVGAILILAVAVRLSGCSTAAPELEPPASFDAVDVSDVLALGSPLAAAAETARAEAEAAELAEAEQTAQLETQVKVQPAQTPASVSGGGIEWIIYHESHGDPWATNGKYLGIGQLQEHHYQAYLGKSWAEVAGDYVAQLEAMYAYIYDRYGSVDAAVAHAQATGWY